MKKNTLIGTIILLNLGLIYLLKQKNAIIHLQKQSIQHSTQNAQTVQLGESFISTKYWWEMNSQGDLVEEVQLVSDLSEEQDTFLLSELIGNQPKLVLRYSEIHCDVCIDSTLTRVKQFAEVIGKENILLISSYKNPRDMYLFKRLNQIDLPLYNLQNQSLGIAAERADTPYFFILQPNRKTERVYLFYKEIAQHIDSYFNILQDKYFDV